jgi:hypothetical protein
MGQLPGLWICGDRRIQLISADPADEQVRWCWDSSIADGVPEDRRDWLHAIDEVKPVLLDGEPCLLLTASWRGAVALLRRRDRTLLFLAPLPNAHSAELLPGGWLACAGSDGSDCLHIHHVSDGILTEAPRLALPLPHGHGAVFSPSRSRLWVCGGRAVRAYRWASAGATCSCELEREIVLPDDGAHDLMVDAAGTGLVVTTDARVWHVDPVDGALTPFAPLHRLDHVKSLSHAADGTLAYTKAPGGRIYSAEAVTLIAPDGAIRHRPVPGGYLYKVRWDRPCQLP